MPLPLFYLDSTKSIMPPKKAASPKKKGGKKKGADGDALFNEFLDDMFYISKPERSAMKERSKKDIRETFTLFQERGRDAVDVRELGVIVRDLGLNPSEKQLATIRTLVEDPENPNFVTHSTLEKVVLDIIEKKELEYEEVTAEGAPIRTKSLLYRQPERQIQRAFDVLWDALGRKVDSDHQRFLDSDALREYITDPESPEAFNEDEIKHFLAAAQDVGTTSINEDLFIALSLE